MIDAIRQDRMRGRGRAVLAACLIGAAVLAALLLPAGGGAGARGVAPLGKSTLATIPQSAVYSTTAPGAENLLYVVGKQGSIYTLDVSQPEPEPQRFLRVPSGQLSTDGERGLLSVAFAPDFETSRRLYVYFTNDRGDIEIDEYRASTDLAAQRDTRRKVITIPHRRNSNHNGGTAAFGPDGLLYIGTGDGGSGGDPPENAQNREVLLGKMLRIDPRRSNGKPYTVPRSNPFTGDTKGRGEILALGLRNPFRFSFAGEVAWIGDVGQGSWEEVDRANPGRLNGANFGWDRWEGTHRYRDPSDPSSPRPKPANHTLPFHEYSHGGGRCSITGGVVAPGEAASAIAGRYLFADFCDGEIHSLATTGSDPGDRDEGVELDSPSSFAVGPDLQVYATQLGGQVVVLNSAVN